MLQLLAIHARNKDTKKIQIINYYSKNIFIVLIIYSVIRRETCTFAT